MIDKVLFFLLALFWGGSFLAIKNIVEKVPPFTSAFYRLFASTLFLVIIYRKDLMKFLKINVPIKEIFRCAVTGLCSIAIPFAFLFWGEKYISPSLAAIINGTVPLWTIGLSVLFFEGRNELSFSKLLGLMLGTLGLIIIFLPKLSFQNRSLEVFGILSVIAMAIFYGLGVNLNKILISKNKNILFKQSLIIQQTVSTIFLFLLMIIVEGLPDLNLILVPKILLSVGYLAFFSTALGFIIFYKLINSIGPVKASTVTFFSPAVAVLLDNIFNSRQLQPNEYSGATIVFVSLYFLQKNKPKDLQKKYRHL